MSINWMPLCDELAIWKAEGMSLPFWWRDDDATSSTTALEQLLQLSDDTQVPIHLAVIPQKAQVDLAERLEKHKNSIALIHGWARQNLAPYGQKKCEFGAERDLDERCLDAKDAIQRIQLLFPKRFSPIFVPPWNRVGADLIPLLPKLGYKAVSTFKPRVSALAADGLVQINTHLDPIDWRGTRSLVDPEQLVTQMVNDLKNRRNDESDNAEPYGFLTHHLVHDAAIWDFAKALLYCLAESPAVYWRADKQQDIGDQLT